MLLRHWFLWTEATVWKHDNHTAVGDQSKSAGNLLAASGWSHVMKRLPAIFGFS